MPPDRLTWAGVYVSFRSVARASRQADEALRRWAHTMFHVGEGRLPRSCEWCREELAGAGMREERR